MTNYRLPLATCPFCGSKWAPRVKVPVRCPRCNRILEPVRPLVRREGGVAKPRREEEEVRDARPPECL